MFAVHRKLSGSFAPSLLIVGLLTLAGCADGGGSGSTATSTAGNGLASGGASSIYVIQQPTSGANSYILQYPIGSSTNLTPTATLIPPASFYATAVATDTSGQIYVGGYLLSSAQAEVLVYSAGATGSATPVRTILGGYYYNASNATFVVPETMAVSSTGVLYLASYDQSYLYVTSLSSTANGLAVPAVQITGSSTQLYDPLGIAADAAGNIYVSQDIASGTGTILVYASGATGNATPARTISSTNIPYGLAVDASSNIYTVLDSATSSVAGSIVEFAAGANGAATPTRTIAGSSTVIFFGGGLRVDGVGNIYMINETATGAASVLAFPPTANGNVAPPVVFSSAALSSPSSELAIH